MRFVNLFRWDLRFQARYGFYLLYGFLTILYVIVLFSLPASWKGNAAAILIFSDPAAMGLFFMGAIVLLEKSQRVTSFFAITPLSAYEYVCSKVLSLGIIGVIVAGLLAKAAGCTTILSVLAGTLLSSVFFTLFGIIIATKINSLNQFILATVPVEIVGFVPAVLHLFGVTPALLGIYPANACMDMIAGKGVSVSGLALTLGLIVLLFWIAQQSVEKMWLSQGGIKI